MDPDKTLERILALLDRRLDNEPSANRELNDAIVELHCWLERGGFLPRAWARTAPAEARVITRDGREVWAGTVTRLESGALGVQLEVLPVDGRLVLR